MKKIITLLLLCVFFGCGTKKKSELEIDMPSPKVQVPTKAENLLKVHNEFRKKYDRDELTLDENLNIYAQKHAEYMSKNKKLVHSNLSVLLPKNNYVAENIAYNQSDEISVVRDWMNSSGHKKNILNKKYKKVGFGFSESEDGTRYWCAVFTN